MLGWTPEVASVDSLFEGVAWFQPQRAFWTHCVSWLTGRQGVA